jgi:hypothetical protein
MTAGGGSIAVSVQVPVLGKVIGKQSLKDIAAGNPPKPPVSGPAVVVKDADARTLAKLGSKPAPVAPTPTVAEPPVSAEPVAAAPVRPAPARPAAPEKDPEAEANKLLQLAENYLRANMKSMAVRKLETIVKDYPKTEAAETAQAKLAKLK